MLIVLDSRSVPRVLAPFHRNKSLVVPFDFRSGPFCGFESRSILPPMKKARVIIKTVTKHHQVYVEQDGERFLYALTSDLEQAKKLVQEAKREFGIGRPGKPRNDTDAPAE
jgi:hypothetical protein